MRQHPVRLLAAWVVAMAAAAGRAEPQPLVTITGGADGSGQNYSWTITNRHSSPIVFIEIPHYRADTFVTPAGWQQECTNLMIAGQAREPGVCRAWPKPNASGLTPGRSAEFALRVAREGAQRRTGTVLVKFADGTQVSIPGVEVPTRESVPERFAALIGMALIVGLLIVFQLRARRKAVSARPPGTPAAGA